jgi:peptidoglycan/LPS O-acetylase OafA/YrhL
MARGRKSKLFQTSFGFARFEPGVYGRSGWSATPYTSFTLHFSLLRTTYLKRSWPRFAGKNACDALLALAVSICAAYVSWYAMELRILRWMDRKVPSPARP